MLRKSASKNISNMVLRLAIAFPVDVWLVYTTANYSCEPEACLLSSFTTSTIGEWTFDYNFLVLN